MPDVAAQTAKLEQANKNELAILRQDTVPGIGRTILALRRSLQEIRGNTRISGSEMVTQTNAARASAQTSLDKIEATATSAIAMIRDDLASRTATKLDTQEAILDQLNLQSAQRRVDQMRAAKVDVGQIIQRAAAVGDTLVLRVLRQELPSATGSDYASQQRLESLMDQLDRAEAPLMSATQQAARLILDELKAGSANLSTSFQMARAEAGGASQTSSSGYPVGTVTTIADWGRGMPYRIDEKNPDGGNTSADTPVAPGTTGYTQHPAPNFGKPNRDGQ
jgi:hypothetical protein